MKHNPTTGQFTGPSKTAEERFWEKVEKTDGCWLWTASLGQHGGYGQFNNGTTMEPSHRFAYKLIVGPIPPELELDHLCRVRRCVNPAHLEVVDHRTNTMRGLAPLVNGAMNRSKTHCPQGHPYDAINTIWYGNHRSCRICKRAGTRRWRERMRNHG